MTEQIEQFAKDCGKLPGVLKGWAAYKELKQEIDDMIEILPMVEGLAKDSIRNRHWDEIIEITKEDIPYQEESFNFEQLMAAPLLKFKDDVDDISERADKELKLEKSLNNDVIAFWEDAELEIKMWKGIDSPCLLGGNIQDI
jgi:dynein heavy chain